MDDLIRRQDAVDVILADKIDDTSLKVMTALGDGRLALTLNSACDRHIQEIEKLPSAQPEIIYCKDCRFLIDEGDGYMCGNSKGWVVGTDAEFGCVLAERRTDG